MLLRVRILVLCACVPLNRNAAGKYCFYVCECVNDAVFSGRTVCLEGWWWCGWLIWIMVWWWWSECGLVLLENCDGCGIVLKKLWLFEFFHDFILIWSIYIYYYPEYPFWYQSYHNIIKKYINKNQFVSKFILSDSKIDFFFCFYSDSDLSDFSKFIFFSNI